MDKKLERHLVITVEVDSHSERTTNDIIQETQRFVDSLAHDPKARAHIEFKITQEIL